MAPTYQPKPVDTSYVALAEDLEQLTELLAENAHDIWSAQRIGEGWTYGLERDDTKKTHPDLVPYRKLSDSEKDYDRNTTMATLKAIVALGYVIRKQS